MFLPVLYFPPLPIPPTVDTSITTVTMIWKYLGEVIFNMLILVGMVKGADKICHEMLGV